MEDVLVLGAITSTPGAEIPTETRFPKHFLICKQQETISQNVLGRGMGCFAHAKRLC